MEANEMQELKELIEFLKANEIAEFDLERGELKVKLKFMGAVQAAAAPAAAGGGGLDMGVLARLLAQGGGGAAPAAVPALATASSAAPAVEEKKHHVVKSPIVGTFYEAPSPGSPPFVKVGGYGRGGAGALHRRSDEADERDRKRHGGGDRGEDCRGRAAGGIWPAAVFDSCEVEEGLTRIDRKSDQCGLPVQSASCDVLLLV